MFETSMKTWGTKERKHFDGGCPSCLVVVIHFSTFWFLFLMPNDAVLPVIKREKKGHARSTQFTFALVRNGRRATHYFSYKRRNARADFQCNKRPATNEVRDGKSSDSRTELSSYELIKNLNWLDCCSSSPTLSWQVWWHTSTTCQAKSSGYMNQMM